MARPRKSSSSSQHVFSAGQAKYVLERLIGDRRVTRADVQRYVSDMRREIGDLEERLKSLRDATSEAIRGAIEAITPGRPGRRRGRPPGSSSQKAAGAAKGGKKRRRSRITPEQLASRQLQGRYLGLIRQIPASRRGQYQKIAKDRGREAAIKELQTVLKK